MAGSPEYLDMLDNFQISHEYFDNREQAWERLTWSWDWFEVSQNFVTLNRLADVSLTLLEYEYGDRSRNEILIEARQLHIQKNKGYAGHTDDPWSNFRLANKFKVSTAQGLYVRLSDKYSRLISLRTDANNDQVGEPITETLRDFFAYCLIALCILMEGIDYV